MPPHCVLRDRQTSISEGLSWTLDDAGIWGSRVFANTRRWFGVLKRFTDCRDANTAVEIRRGQSPADPRSSLTPPRPAGGRPPQKQTIWTVPGLSAGVWLLTNVKLIYLYNVMLKVCEGVYAGKLSAL